MKIKKMIDLFEAKKCIYLLYKIASHYPNKGDIEYW